MKIKFFKKILVFLFFLFVGYIYLHNLTRDVYGGDIGDLVTAAYVFGVAHPPGYPLFSLLGFIMSHLPIPLPVVSKVGLISVFSSLAGLVVYYKFSFKVSKSVFISLLSTSILAFSYLFWLTAEIPEGLGLNNFFVIVILFLAIRFYEREKTKYLYLLALFIGLSLTHQFFIMTLFPAIFILIIKHYKFIFLSKKRFFITTLCFLAGLSVYIYIPIAAFRNPPINWDNAVNLKNFLHLVLRKDYGGISYGSKNISLAVRLINVSHYLKTIISVFSYQILFVAFLGFIKLFKIDKRFFITLLLAFLLTGLLTIFFTAQIIYSSVTWGVAERYYSVSTAVLMFVVPYGFIFLKDFLNSKFSKPIYSYVILLYFLIVPLMLIKYNFPKTDLSKTKIGKNLADNIFLSLPKNSILFTSGDNMTFDLWYSYYVLKERNDVVIINFPWVGYNNFLNMIVNDYYLKNPNTDLKNIISKTLDAFIVKRRIYFTNNSTSIPKDTILVPKGIVYEIIKKNDLPKENVFISNSKNIWDKVKVQTRKNMTPANENFIASEIPLIYSKALVSTGYFLMQNYNNSIKAEFYFRKALLVDESIPEVFAGLAMSQFKNNNCPDAIKNIQNAISLYPIWQGYYIQQYYLTKNCGLSQQKLSKLKLKYNQRFNRDIEKDLPVK